MIYVAVLDEKFEGQFEGKLRIFMSYRQAADSAVR